VAPHPRGPILLVASRWIKNKGLDLLVPLCRALDHREVWVTEHGLSSGLRADLTHLEHVRLVGNLPMGRLLSGAGVLLVPSRWPEPFGRVAFEGLAAGVPTLASAVGGLREFVPPAQLVEPPDLVPAWIAAVRRLEHEASWRAARRDGIAAASAVMRRAPLARLEDVIREVAASRDSRPSPSERQPARAIRQEMERAHVVGLSVPKAGRSWVCYFLARYGAERTGNPLDLDLLTGRELPPVAFVHEHLDVFQDVAGPGRLLNEDLLMRRRIIVLVRDPRDSLVSYWHHKRVRDQRPVPDRLEQFADCPVYGIERLAQGTGLLLDLYDRHPGDRLLVTYEDLVSDPARGLTRILRFVLAGAPVDDRARRAALAASRFEHMRDWERSLTREEARLRYRDRFGPRADAPSEDGHFKVRRGEVGGFVSEMSPRLRRHVASLPHTAALLERLAAIRG
jgi:hypothetical protein